MTDFASFCAAHGLLVDRPIADGRIHRVKTRDKPRKRNGAYRLEGEWGWAHNWATMLQPEVWRADGPRRPAPARPSAEARGARAAEFAARRTAAERAREIVGACDFRPHPYLEVKGFRGRCGLVDDRERLVVPMRWFRDTRRIQSVQFITPSGEKKFLPGGAAAEAVFMLGRGDAPETWLCEGLTTGMSVEAALERLYRPARVLVCFSAGNLVRVARQLEGRVFAVCDHDRPNPQTGLRAGHVAAEQCGHPAVMPPLEGDDANDLHQRDGIDALVELLRGAMT